MPLKTAPISPRKTSSNENAVTIIGIDPGTLVSGYGVIEVKAGNFTALDYGCIRPPPKLELHKRYLVIFRAVEDLIEKYNPCAVVVETQYVQRNIQSAIKLGMARGTVIVAAGKSDIPTFEYSPTRAKKAVVGRGSASKQQVQWMIKHLLNLPELPEPEDASDALALALCHAFGTRN